MKTIAIAGNLGRNAEHRTTQSGQELCSFPVAVTDGWGDNKSTLWFDVTRWGKGASGLAKTLSKGSKVAVSGELSAREHNGKTYLQVRADTVTILGTPDSRQSQQSEQSTQSAQSWGDDQDPPF